MTDYIDSSESTLMTSKTPTFQEILDRVKQFNLSILTQKTKNTEKKEYLII